MPNELKIVLGIGCLMASVLACAFYCSELHMECYLSFAMFETTDNLCWAHACDAFHLSTPRGTDTSINGSWLWPCCEWYLTFWNNMTCILWWVLGYSVVLMAFVYAANCCKQIYGFTHQHLHHCGYVWLPCAVSAIEIYAQFCWAIPWRHRKLNVYRTTSNDKDVGRVSKSKSQCQM